ncbi:MAG: hypothetical protein HC853_04380 [Anaerolineae bacterium]|nr:hypothetical protein [Anaerolineae bacterium]
MALTGGLITTARACFKRSRSSCASARLCSALADEFCGVRVYAGFDGIHEIFI